MSLASTSMDAHNLYIIEEIKKIQTSVITTPDYNKLEKITLLAYGWRSIQNGRRKPVQASPIGKYQ